MKSTICQNCGSDLTTTNSIRIAEYHFGRLEKNIEQNTNNSKINYILENPDTYTILCNTCKRLVKTLPIIR